jgi:hypothetical protein
MRHRVKERGVGQAVSWPMPALNSLLQTSAGSARQALGYLGEDEAKNCLNRGIIHKAD